MSTEKRPKPGLLKRLLFPMSDEDIESEREDELRQDFARGGASDGGNSSGIEEGSRSENWYDEIDDQVDENTKMTYSNNKRIAVIDERTAIIVRILLGILITFIGGVVVWAFTNGAV